MGQLIAFEGPDLAGKTTRLESLKRHARFARWPQAKLQLPELLMKEGDERAVKEMEDMAMPFYEALVQFKKTASFFMDRCYPTTWVYSRIYGYSLDPEPFRYLQRVLQPLIIYVRTTKETLLERMDQRGDRLLRSGYQLLAVAQAYEEWYRDNPFGDRVLVVSGESWDELRAEDLAQQIDELVSGRRSWKAFLEKLP